MDLKTILERCPAKMRNHFLFATRLSHTPRMGNGTEYVALEEYASRKALEYPTTRSKEENLALLWIYIFMIIHMDQDLAKAGSRALSKMTLIKVTCDLASHLTLALKIDK